MSSKVFCGTVCCSQNGMTALQAAIAAQTTAALAQNPSLQPLLMAQMAQNPWLSGALQNSALTHLSLLNGTTGLGSAAGLTPQLPGNPSPVPAPGGSSSPILDVTLAQLNGLDQSANPSLPANWTNNHLLVFNQATQDWNRMGPDNRYAL